MTDDQIDRSTQEIEPQRTGLMEEAIDDLTDWMMEVAASEEFVDVGCIISIRDGRIVRKRRIHESFE